MRGITRAFGCRGLWLLAIIRACKDYWALERANEGVLVSADRRIPCRAMYSVKSPELETW